MELFDIAHVVHRLQYERYEHTECAGQVGFDDGELLVNKVAAAAYKYELFVVRVVVAGDACAAQKLVVVW